MSKPYTTNFWEKARQSIRIRNEHVKVFIGEALGTGILCFFALGAVTQHYIQGTNNSMQPAFGGMIGLMIAILIAGGLSGPHLNPAVTLGMAIAGDCSWLMLPTYWIAQIFGGYLGSGLAFSTYCWYGSRHELGYTSGLPPNIFSHLPSPTNPTPIINGIFDQALATAVLMLTVLAVIDKRNMQVPKSLLALYISLVVNGLILCFGYNSGSPINSARDLGPRLMAVTLGYRVEDVFTPGGKQWWTVGFFGPLIGGALGSFVYIVCVGAHLDDTKEEQAEKKIKEQRRQLSMPFPPQQPPQSAYQTSNNNGAYQQAYQRQGPHSGPPSAYASNIGHNAHSVQDFRGGANGKSYA